MRPMLPSTHLDFRIFNLSGTDVETSFLNTIGIANTSGGVIFSGCDVVAPGVVQVESVKSRLILGHADGRVSQSL